MSSVEIRINCDEPEIFDAALSPDNTRDMETYVDDGLVTRIERDELGSLNSTADDYLKNLKIAHEIYNS